MENQNSKIQMKTEKPKLKLITTYIEAKQYKRLKSISKQTGAKPSELIRISINNFIQISKTKTND